MSLMPTTMSGQLSQNRFRRMGKEKGREPRHEMVAIFYHRRAEMSNAKNRGCISRLERDCHPERVDQQKCVAARHQRRVWWRCARCSPALAAQVQVSAQTTGLSMTNHGTRPENETYPNRGRIISGQRVWERRQMSSASDIWIPKSRSTEGDRGLCVVSATSRSKSPIVPARSPADRSAPVPGADTPR